MVCFRLHWICDNRIQSIKANAITTACPNASDISLDIKLANLTIDKSKCKLKEYYETIRQPIGKNNQRIRLKTSIIGDIPSN